MPNAKMSCFVDTSVIVHTVDRSEPEKRQIATSLLRRTIKNRTLVLSPQSLNECYRVVTDRRQFMSREDARELVSDLSGSCTAPLDFAVTCLAWHFQDQTGFSFWDCLLLASASVAGCGIFKLPHLNDLPI